jgi:hypothetical protein
MDADVESRVARGQKMENGFIGKVGVRRAPDHVK